jgi:Leucine-rich repeat (LRR) protein
LPASLTHLKCYGSEQFSQLKDLPELPNSLQYLDCCDNRLTSLPELPESLKYLNCSDNILTTLPELPKLDVLYCNNNLLGTLPDVPESLKSLYCFDNKYIDKNFKDLEEESDIDVIRQYQKNNTSFEYILK